MDGVQLSQGYIMRRLLRQQKPVQNQWNKVKAKVLLFAVTSFFFTLNSFFFLVISSFILQYMRSLKPTFIDFHCYASSFPGLLSLLPSNAVSTASLSSRLWVIHTKTKKATSAPPSCLFLIFWMQLQKLFFGITNRIVKPVCFVRIWGLRE